LQTVQTMRKRISKATRVVGGTLFGTIFGSGFHTVVEETNSLAFFTSCHEMSYVYEEYMEKYPLQKYGWRACYLFRLSRAQGMVAEDGG